MGQRNTTALKELGSERRARTREDKKGKEGDDLKSPRIKRKTRQNR